MRLADHFQVRADTLGLHHGGVRTAARVVDLTLLVGCHVDVEDDFLEDFELLTVFVHAHKLLQDELWDELAAELTGDYRSA